VKRGDVQRASLRRMSTRCQRFRRIPKLLMNYYNDNDPFACEWARNLIEAGEVPNGIVDERPIEEVMSADLDGYRQCHFFAGILGWPLALKLAGWPADDAPVWTGSAPCQPFSTAGKGKGIDDERHLWPEFLRLITECRPPVIFGEQVSSAEVVGTQLEAAFVDAVQYGDYARANKLAKRLTQSHGFHYGARWVDRVHADLEAIGYAFRFTILGAHSTGSPHIRQRLFWVAYAQYEQPRTRDSGEQGDSAEHGRDRPSVDGVADGLGDTNSSESPQPEEQSARQEFATAPGAGWHVVHCGDGKTRRVPDPESGIQCLAHGIPRKLGPPLTGMGQVGIRAARANRVGRLKGYGNALHIPTAVRFIAAYLEASNE
jgi:DNA (cytosine-5)-methyltransferase 1